MAATPAHSIMEPPQNGVITATVQASPGPTSQSAQNGQQMSTNETHILKVSDQGVGLGYCKLFHFTFKFLMISLKEIYMFTGTQLD